MNCSQFTAYLGYMAEITDRTSR